MAAGGARQWVVVGFGVLAMCLGMHCGPAELPNDGPGAQQGRPSAGTPPDAGPRDGEDGDDPVPPEPQAPQFQTVFGHALRSGESTSGVRTYRVRLPSVLAGERVRVTFRSGSQGMRLLRAFVSTAAEQTPIPLPLPTGAGDVAPETRVRSEPAALSVRAGDEVWVTFEVEGSVATSAIDALPDTEVAQGAHADAEGPLGGSTRNRIAGVVALEVEAPPGPVFVALGDSITEGYVNGRDDIRLAWPQRAATALGIPVVNAGVSAQGVNLAAERLDEEVLSHTGITDCLVLLGTNDLHSHDADQLAAKLEAIFDRLRPHCRVWASPLLPKERTSVGSLSEVLARREAVNAWIRESADLHGVVALDEAVEGDDPGRFATGLGEDGIHPSHRGQEVLGQAAADILDALLPAEP
ncbi:MAG TPA: GDSL-type esterase/lipase family protein [Myxococcaceae bacterium]|nr:GDSL-type esterase/lipase family protein [Myxococcaceae bacterium]